MNIETVLTLTGLLSDIIGAIIISINGTFSKQLNQDFDKDIQKYFNDFPDAKVYYMKIKRRFQFGMALLIIGFVLQFSVIFTKSISSEDSDCKNEQYHENNLPGRK